MFRLIVSLTLFTMAASTGAAEQPPLAQVLERVATYLRQFEKDFAIVLSDEDYNQKDVVTWDPDRRSVTD
jgi:hypothetical protein